MDKLIETTEKEFAAAELPKEVTKAELLLREHESNRDKVKELITFSSEEGEAIVIRVRQQVSPPSFIKHQFKQNFFYVLHWSDV